MTLGLLTVGASSRTMMARKTPKPMPSAICGVRLMDDPSALRIPHSALTNKSPAQHPGPPVQDPRLARRDGPHRLRQLQSDAGLGTLRHPGGDRVRAITDLYLAGVSHGQWIG